MKQLAKLKQCIKEAKNQGSGLILLVGPPSSGKSRILRELSGTKIINLKQELARELVFIAREERPRHVQKVLNEIISLYPDSLVILDNIEILFFPELQLDPLQVLEHFSKDRALLVAWTGSHADNKLTWSNPHHPEYKVYPDIDPAHLIIHLTD